MANLSLTKVFGILTEHKIHHMSIRGGEKHGYDHSIEFDEGCIMFHDTTSRYMLKVKNLKLKAYSKYWTTHNAYVIFSFDFINLLEFDFEGVIETCQDYDFEISKVIYEQAIILHKKYVHKLQVSTKLGRMLDFIPTKKLDLLISSQYSNELVGYLHCYHITKVHAEVKFNELSGLSVHNIQPLV